MACTHNICFKQSWTDKYNNKLKNFVLRFIMRQSLNFNYAQHSNSCFSAETESVGNSVLWRPSLFCPTFKFESLSNGNNGMDKGKILEGKKQRLLNHAMNTKLVIAQKFFFFFSLSLLKISTECVLKRSADSFLGQLLVIK